MDIFQVGSLHPELGRRSRFYRRISPVPENPAGIDRDSIGK